MIRTLVRCRQLLALAGLAACAAPPPVSPRVPPPITRRATSDELVRVRCALDGRDVFTTWTGTAYSFIPGERQRELFAVVGMNVARCLRTERGWRLTSRELMYYLDPATGAVLHRWTNPWTGATVPVVHVANALVQIPLTGSPRMDVVGDTATIAVDVPLFYPNRLAGGPLEAFSPEPDYQAGEFFSLAAPAAAVVDPQLATVPEMTLTWFRISPWLPWMNMGGQPGRLVVSGRGHKAASIDQLPAVLKQEIEQRLPLYRSAPRCIVDATNQTSWTYFAAHAAQYQAGERFPLPAADSPHECAR